MIASEIVGIWIRCNVYCTSIKSVEQRIENLVKDFRKIDGYVTKHILLCGKDLLLFLHLRYSIPF